MVIRQLKKFIKTKTNFIPTILLALITPLTVSHLRTLPTKASVTTPVSVTVPSSCSFSADADTHSTTITSGLLEELDGITLTSICNGAYDSQILAIGFTNNVEGNTTLSSTTNTINTLDNCSPISPSSCWSMKVTGLDTDTYPFIPQNNYDTYKSIPEKETLVAKTELKTEANPKSVLKIYMQSMVSEQCTSDPITVYDNRDETEYRIARLADGKCWMLDNLAIDTSTVTLTTENTNMKSGVSAKANRASVFDSWTSPQINVSHKNDYVDCAIGQSCTGKVGMIYNYCAASAGTYCKSNGSLSGDAQYDVCPYGWRLPTGGDNGEYNALYLAYNSDGARFSRELHLLLSGAVGKKGYDSANSWGSYWTSTRYSSSGMWILGVYANQIIPVYRDPRYLSDGNTLRCVLNS